MRSLATLLISLGLCAGPTLARELQVEVDVLHTGGMLSASELEAMLSDARLSIEAVYQPTRLIDDVTARRERTLPLGSRLIAIPQSQSLRDSQVKRQGRTLRFQVADIHPGHADYRLHQLALRTPVAPGMGRPQPDLQIDLLNPVPRSGAHETAAYGRYGAFDLGLRLRYRWSDEQGAARVAALTCHADIQLLANGQYRFRPQHRLAGLFRFLTPIVQSDPPTRPPAGQRSLWLREPFPGPLAGWKLSRNHLVQLQVDGQTVERLSLYGEQTGSGSCRGTRSYEALFAGGQLVALQRSVHEDSCKGADVTYSHSVEAEWLDDGSLARYMSNTPGASRTWDGFSAAAGASCGTGAAPSTDEVRALKTELQEIREALLAPR
jgi:hypothetical protein